MAPSAKQFEFIDNSLFLTGPSGGRVRLQWYPVPEAHIQLASGRWHPYEPEFRILAPVIPLSPDMPDEDKARLQAKYDAFNAFRASLPGFIVEGVEPFNCYQWPLMRLLKRSIPARDLVKSNPVLAYTLACNEQFCPSTGPEITITRANRYSRRKQREILGWLGFPDTEAMVRLIKKIPLAIVYPGLIRKLRQCAAFPEILKLFAHLPSLNTGILFLASNPEMAPLMTSKLLLEVLEAPEEEMAAPTADLLHEVVTAEAKFGFPDRLRPFLSRRAIEERHGRIQLLQDEYNERLAQQAELKRLNEAARLQRAQERAAAKEKRHAAWVFPPPPIPGTPDIIPLTRFRDLVQESAAQLNCVGRSEAYAQKVMNGETYIYRVLAPQRHTLSIVKRGGCWQIGELQIYKNKGCSEDARIAVQNWLNMNQMAL